MKLSQLKKHLNSIAEVNIIQPNGLIVPAHFHITEAGVITKNFIDCGGTVRTEKSISFQIWVANDINHRLTSAKLSKIIELSEPIFNNEDLEVEVEFQTETISRFDLNFDGKNFLLQPKFTDCLAKDNCGVPSNMLVSDNKQQQYCTPGGGCC
jgi:hypothetical protein